MLISPDWLIPQWPAPKRVHAVCTTRAGGISVSPYDSFNLGDHVGDSPEAVAANRARLHQIIGAQSVFLSQVHGTHLTELSLNTAQGTQADASLTRQTYIACTIMVADCLPVLFTDTSGCWVAAAHAGWRSLLGHGGRGVLEVVVERFRASTPIHNKLGASSILAWLGPCIGPQTFEVGDDVRDAFVTQDPATDAMFASKSGGKWLADLQGLARLRLAALGVTRIYGNDGTPSWCTVSHPSRFFSYRRDGVSGRMAACIWLDD